VKVRGLARRMILKDDLDWADFVACLAD